MTASPDLTSILRTGLGRSIQSLLIKVATAGLTYAMYVILSRTMGAEEYGHFAFGLSLATVLAIGAAMGQQTAILRYWPEERGRGNPAGALAALRSGGALVLVAGSMLTAGLALVALPAGPQAATLLGAAALIVPMGLAEYWSSALRAQGSVWIALAPRDLFWRLATPLLVLLLFGAGAVLAGWAALLATAVLLALALLLQYGLARRRGLEIAPGTAGLGAYWGGRGRASVWFLFGTIVDSAALNLDTIFIGLLVTAESAGIYFNAFRTAGLLTLFMFAITLVVAPMVAEHYHKGEMRKAQAITALCAWAGFGFSLAVFAVFVAFGREILSLFGGAAADGYWVLLLLSVGLLFDAATGPSRIVMMMTGHERDYVRLFGAIMLAGLVVELLVIPVWGLVGAAAVNAASRAVAQLTLAWWSRRHIGLDTSLAGIARVHRLSDEARPAARA